MCKFTLLTFLMGRSADRFVDQEIKTDIQQRSCNQPEIDVTFVDASEEIAARMLQGWTLLAEHCNRYFLDHLFLHHCIYC